MKLRELKCENCGASLKVDENVSQVECEFCHTVFAVEDSYHEGYKFEKGRIKAYNEQFEKNIEHVKGIMGPIGKFFTIHYVITAIVALVIFAIVIITFVTIATKQVNFKNNNVEKNVISEFDIKSFNNTFEMYSGTEYGLSVRNLIDKVSTNNKKDDVHQITIKYKDVTTTEPEKLKELKNELDDWTQYEVSFEYDENKFIYLVIIE